MPATLLLRADVDGDVEHAAELLRTGRLVAFGTETVYGLGAHALSPNAVAKIFAAKGRPAWDPLIVHVTGLSSAEHLVCAAGWLQERAMRLAEAFWPGPLTMLLPRTSAVPDAVTAGRPLVGLRAPGHPAAQALLRAADLPIAAPSANRFGHTSPTTARHVLEDLAGRIDAVLDTGPCAVGVESTVVDVGLTPMLVYRAGAVSLSSLAEAAGVPAELFKASGPVSTGAGRAAEPSALPSPGVGIRHYAPAVPLHMSAPSPESLRALAASVQETEGGVGVLLPSDWPFPALPGALVHSWGAWSNAEQLAAELFAGIRALEAAGVGVMVCPLPEPGGLRDALRDRLFKAAAKG